MKRLMMVLSLALVTSVAAQDTKKENDAIKPAKKNPERHEGFLGVVKKGGVDLLFMGDSITDAWGGEPRKGGGGYAIFKKEFEPMKAANFGISGDRTQHVLWRLQNGELDGIQPKVMMLMIGTNNMGGNTPQQIADGIEAILKEVKTRSPKTKVLLLGIFPRSAKAEDPIRKKVGETNEIIKKFDDDGKSVKYLDIGKKFLQEDGTLSREIMPDLLHLSAKGYQIWADAVKGPIEELMK